MASRFSILASIAVAILVTISAPAMAAQGGLTTAQLHQLQGIPFAVVPGRVPPGYSVKNVYVDKSAHKYTIQYAGPRGALITISGVGTRKAQAASGPPKKHHGIFQQIGSAFTNLANNTKDINPLRSANAKASENANKNGGTSGEEEEEMTSLSADSPVVGPASFANKDSCLRGTGDSSQAEIKDATFTVSGCKLKVPDALTQMYRSLERVHH